MGNRKSRDRLDVLADKPGDAPHEDPPPTTRCSSWGGLSLPYGVLGHLKHYPTPPFWLAILVHQLDPSTNVRRLPGHSFL